MVAVCLRDAAIDVLAGTDQRSGIVAGLPVAIRGIAPPARPRFDCRVAGQPRTDLFSGPQVDDAFGLALGAGHGAGIPDLDLGRDPDHAFDVLR